MLPVLMLPTPTVFRMLAGTMVTSVTTLASAAPAGPSAGGAATSREPIVTLTEDQGERDRDHGNDRPAGQQHAVAYLSTPGRGLPGRDLLVVANVPLRRACLAHRADRPPARLEPSGDPASLVPRGCSMRNRVRAVRPGGLSPVAAQRPSVQIRVPSREASS